MRIVVDLVRPNRSVPKIAALLPGILDGRAASEKLDAASVDLRFNLVEHLIAVLLCQFPLFVP